MFNIIDTENWPRREIFYYFSQMAPTGYSLTVDIDVTKLIEPQRHIRLNSFPFICGLLPVI